MDSKRYGGDVNPVGKSSASLGAQWRTERSAGRPSSQVGFSKRLNQSRLLSPSPSRYSPLSLSFSRPFSSFLLRLLVPRLVDSDSARNYTASPFFLVLRTHWTFSIPLFVFISTELFRTSTGELYFLPFSYAPPRVSPSLRSFSRSKRKLPRFRNEEKKLPLDFARTCRIHDVQVLP